MFCGGFLESKPAGRRSKTGLCGWGLSQGSGDCGGSSLFTGMRWGGRDFVRRRVFPILWYKGAAACAYYSLKRR